MIEMRVMDKGVPEQIAKMAAACAHPRKPLADLGGHWQRRVVKSMPDKGPMEAAAAGAPPGVHSAEYAHSMLFDVAADAQSEQLGSSSIRARVLNEGAVIMPRRAQLLTIPISVQSYGKRAADFPKMHRQGMALGIGDGDEFEPLFALARSVTIKPHPHMEILQEDWDVFGRALEKQIDEDAQIQKVGEGGV